MEMKLYERKYTTDVALEQMQAIFRALNERLADDMNNFSSGVVFDCKIIKGNGRSPSDLYYAEYVFNRGEVIYRNGEFKIWAQIDDNDDVGGVIEVDDFNWFTKMNFVKMTDSLVAACKKYNDWAEAKDAEIERFLQLADSFLRC